jgi:protocatechuate 3,4-dioxygenase, beta subunit
MNKKTISLPMLFLLILSLQSCEGQRARSTVSDKEKIVGGGCDGCELMYIGMPQQIYASDTSTGWNERGQKLLITGTIYQLDGKTPAPNVIVYYWQTDANGYYSPAKGMDEQAARHGHIRGWVKTTNQGKYSVYTIRPAPYPNRDIPAHIHISIKERGIKTEYYIDDLVFDDDRLLVGSQRKRPENRGGSGVLRVVVSDDLQIAEHNIILGLHIPHYPVVATNELPSGLAVGEDQPSFIPYHAWGPDKGTKTCPVCKYGRYHGIVYFVGNQPKWSDIRSWLLFLEQESVKRSKYLKAYFVYGNEKRYSHELRRTELEKMGQDLHLKNMALTFVPSFTDPESEVNLNKVNPDAENTFIVYRHSTIVGKFINLSPTPENFKRLSATLDKTMSPYFNLPAPRHD